MKRILDRYETFARGTAFAFVMGVPTPALAQGLPPPPASPMPVSSYEYDAQGNLTAVIQGAHGAVLTNRYVYDGLSRVRLASNGAGSSLFNYVGGRAELAEVQDPRRLTTSYSRNGFGQIQTLSSPDTGPAMLTYDVAGNVNTRQDSRGVLVAYSYDPLARLTNATYSWSGMAPMIVDWRYDEVGTDFAYGIGRLTSTSYAGGSSRYAYDAQGRVVQSLQRTDTGGGTQITLATRYGFDNVGTLRQIQYPSGNILRIEQAGGLPVALTLTGAGGQNSTELLRDIVYQPFGPPRAWNWVMSSQAQRHERVFDTAGLMVRYPVGGLLRDLTYDAGGRVISYTHIDRYSSTATATATALNQSFSYDTAGRLSGVQRNSGNSVYSYDANGNRISATVGGMPVGYAVSPSSNRVTGVSGGNRGMAHDAAGNTISDAGSFLIWTAGYDLANRLATLSTSQLGKPQATTGYSYNAFGQRVVKLAISQPPAGGNTPSGPPGGALIFVYGEDGQLIGEYSAVDGKPWREYVWLGSIPVAVIAFDPPAPSGTVYYIHADHLDTPRVVTDRAGKERWTWLSEPFGTDPPNQNPAGLGNFVFNLRMPGQYFDGEAGLIYNYFRNYDATLGRYTQSDPIGLAGGINTYAYVGSDPVNRVDPLGLWETAAHDYFIDRLFGDLPPALRDIIKEGSASTDTPKYQGPDSTGLHAMTSKSLSREQARQQMCKFIKDNLSRSNAAKSQGDPRYLFYLGMALHPVMDYTSPAHRGWQTWRGSTDALKHGPWPTSLETLQVAKQQRYTDKTVDLMRRALAGDLMGCECQ